MSEFEFLLPCPGCNERIPEKSERCPHCNIEVIPAKQGVGLVPRFRICEICHEQTEGQGPCEHCGANPEDILPERMEEKFREDAEHLPEPKLPNRRNTKIVKPWDHIPNPLASFMDEKTMMRLGFNYELRWSYLVIGVGCFFLFRLFFILLVYNFSALLSPTALASDIIHGTLVGALVGMRGSGVGNGAKFGAFISFIITFILLFPIVIFALVGVTALVPESFLIGGETIFSVWVGLSGASAISGAIVGAFIGFYIDHARQ